MLKNRNFDPESRTLKKRTHKDGDVEMETVEKQVEGMAENIIAEDEEKRAQELVHIHLQPLAIQTDKWHRTCSTSLPKDRTGT